MTWSEPLIETRSAVLDSEEKRGEGMKFAAAVTAVLWMCLALRTATVQGKKKKKKTHNMYLNC